MKAFTAAALASLFAAVTARVDGVVHWDLQKRERNDYAAERLGRRAQTYEETIINDQVMGGYFATCEMGTPPQKITLQLDTGSSDIWVPASGASVCSDKNSGGCTLGTFNSKKSSTFDDFGPGSFNITYVDGSTSTGDYFRDVFQISSATLTNMTMGLGTQTNIPYGLVGVGYALNEAIVSTELSTAKAYPNLPINMVNEGLINTIAYSLWLNDLDASTGSILFGGIDTDKYHGEMKRIDIYPTHGYYASFRVALTSVSAHSGSGADALSTSQWPVHVVLDSGTTLSYLPQDLAEQAWTEVGAEYYDEMGIALVPCSLQHSGGYFSFGFGGQGGPVINVTMDELVLDLTSGQSPKFESGPYKGKAACEFGIQNFSSAPYLLGDTFLRSAYVVYDLTNNQIGLAPTDFNSTTSNVVAFSGPSGSIPSSTPAPSQSSISGGSTTSPPYSASSGFQSANAAVRGVSLSAVAQLPLICITVLILLGSGAFNFP